jgi:hypothetical protein
MSVIVFIFNLSQNDQRLIQVITGVVPWLGLLYGVSQVGKDLFHVLGIGAYLTLLAGLALVFAPAYPPKGHV